MLNYQRTEANWKLILGEELKQKKLEAQRMAIAIENPLRLRFFWPVIESLQETVAKAAKDYASSWRFYLCKRKLIKQIYLVSHFFVGMLLLKNPFGCVWKCRVPLNPMVLLIIIPIYPYEKWL